MKSINKLAIPSRTMLPANDVVRLPARRREELRKEHEERRKLEGAANAPDEAQVNAPSDVHGD